MLARLGFSTVLALALGACHAGGDRWPPGAGDEREQWLKAWLHEVAEYHPDPASTVCRWAPPHVGPPLVASPTGLVNQVSYSQGPHDFEIANVGSSPVTITKVTLYLCYKIDWTPIEAVPPTQQWVQLLESNCAGATLGPGESCTVRVNFGFHTFRAKIEVEDASGVVLEIPLGAYP
jgi:hypothetical protein